MACRIAEHGVGAVVFHDHHDHVLRRHVGGGAAVSATPASSTTALPAQQNRRNRKTNATDAPALRLVSAA